MRKDIPGGDSAAEIVSHSRMQKVCARRFMCVCVCVLYCMRVDLRKDVANINLFYLKKKKKKFVSHHFEYRTSVPIFVVVVVVVSGSKSRNNVLAAGVPFGEGVVDFVLRNEVDR